MSLPTAHRILIPAAELASLLERPQPHPPLVLLDCRFDLADPAAGEAAYATGHLPGAHYVHLDRDLSGPQHDDRGRMLGRHPLPDALRFATLVLSLGIDRGVQVVTYDAQGGVYASRAWWLLRWIGHPDVAVLDVGMAAWSRAGGTLDTALPAREPARQRTPAEVVAAMPTLQAEALMAQFGRLAVVDARTPERFRGEVEPIDPVAGHIPGALNRPFGLNLGPDGSFKPAAVLAQEWTRLLGGRPPAEVVHQCGSGVTASHNLLAMEHAGLTGSRLYPGSWSEWCADPTRPIARG
jgi:thiosulfate/3-mercaptopyruvate sulfurtransferase